MADFRPIQGELYYYGVNNKAYPLLFYKAGVELGLFVMFEENQRFSYAVGMQPLIKFIVIIMTY